MKKIFRIVALACLLVGGGAATTSCDDDTVTTILNILQNLSQGKTQNFSGELVVEGLKEVEGQYYYMDETNKTAKSSSTCTVQVRGNAATITIPTFTIGGVTVNNLVISNVSYDSQTGSFGSTEYSFPITCSNSELGDIASTEENINDVCAVVTEGQITANGDIRFSVKSLYMNNHAFNIDYVGKIVEE